VGKTDKEEKTPADLSRRSLADADFSPRDPL
jgi:hypothetical protein